MLFWMELDTVHFSSNIWVHKIIQHIYMISEDYKYSHKTFQQSKMIQFSMLVVIFVLIILI